MLNIADPVHGAVVNRHWGVPTPAGLAIPVAGLCPAGSAVRVNGVPAAVDGEQFSCAVEITQSEEDLVAVSEGPQGEQTCSVRVVWDRYSFPRYRFSIDDNSFWLRDVARSGYHSLFDCSYLAMLRRFHDEYGTKFTVNIYFETADGFTLREFPVGYRGEFAECADWLGLAFHARADKPDRPYQDAAPEVLLRDMDRVEEEIRRFAGEDSLVPPTVIHWGMVDPSVIPQLRTRGVRVLSGFFTPIPGGYDINYRLDDGRSAFLWKEGEALKDFESGMVYSRVDLVCNSTPLGDIPEVLEGVSSRPRQTEIMDLFTHEQYFWPFYEHYLPDHEQRLDAALRWMSERGYKPIFLHEGFLGAPE